MNDERLKKLLSAYTVPGARPEQIKAAIQKAQAAPVKAVPTRPFSIWTQIRVQATYLSKWFFMSCCLIALLCLILNIATEKTRTDSIFFGMSSLFLLPCGFALYRTVSSGMFELETACKYNMTKLFAGKLVVLGAVVAVLIFIAGTLAGFSENGFTFRPLLFALVSFMLSAAVVLWFGKRNIKRGVACGILWSLGISGLSAWDRGSEFMNSVSTGIVFLIFGFGLAAVLLTVYRYIKEISYEGVREAWNFSLTA